VLPAGAHAIANQLRAAAVFRRHGGLLWGIGARISDGVAQRVADQRQIVIVRGIRIINIQQGGERPIVAVIDVPSQAYGRREEAFGIHQALAGAAGAYAKARLAGHPVIGLIVGKAMSGAFLAHGYQANRLIAFNDSGVLVHAMGKESAARITLRTVEALEKLAATIPPMAYDVSNYATLGLLSALLDINNPDAPDDHDLSLVSNTLRDAIADARTDASLKCRLGAENRRSSQLVRDRMRASW
ncbi:biotin-independent malonate decarboxylase subunit gamma, partial [Klebsiella pneumoniae]|uniref:biotin-independent malonate decarboxylase subunit gamma n=1 Tax=Klebsiella pneumoniae TaxID=573 RepID=UPI0039659A97